MGWEILLNRAGTTFRKLPDAERENVTEKKAIALMLAQPSMIKRPVLDVGGKLIVGFKPEVYAKTVRLGALKHPGRRGVENLRQHFGVLASRSWRGRGSCDRRGRTVRASRARQSV